MATTFESARDLILANTSILGVEDVPLLEAIGRVLAEEVIAPAPVRTIVVSV